MIKVVNKKNIKKINRITDFYIGRGSILGNPFFVQIYGREECIELYKIHFDYMMKHSFEFRDVVGTATQYENLVCYCAPLKCHGDIIRDWIIKYRKNNKLITH